MMGLYTDYSDADLAAEVTDLRQRIVEVGKAGDAGMAKIAGEGRSVEWTRTVGKGVQQLLNLKELLREAEAELVRRSACGGQAIGVAF